ncbi:MAG: hypothetical protein ABI210_15265 [Abditibacteriaceae bacterium]
MKQQSWSKAKRWFAWLGGGVIVLCLAVGGFWYWINIPPQVKIPTPAMPKPNGYDYFRRAGELYVYDSKGVDEVTSPTIKSTYPIADKEAWLKQNAQSFQLITEGLRYSVRQPPVRSLYTNIPEYAKFRGIARALAVQSHVRAERGDWNGAVQSVLEGYHFGNETVRGGPSIGGLVSIAIRSISLRELGNLVPHTNAATAKMAARKMEEMYENRYPYYKTLENEKWAQVAGNLELMHEKLWQAKLIQSYNSAIFSESANTPTWLDYAKIFVYSKRKLIADLTQMMDAFIDDARQPYIKQKPIAPMGSLLADSFAPILKNQRWNWARYDTYTVVVMTMYALRAYKMDKGHYPKNLKALVPTYLHKVPIDPFDGIAPLHYQLQGEKYLLWSIGPDGVDNHGTPIINLDKKGRSRHLLLFSDSKGDVVAGKNTP